MTTDYIKPLVTYSEVVGDVVIECTRAYPIHTPPPPPNPSSHITALMIAEEERLKKDPLWYKATGYRRSKRKPVKL